MNPEALFKQLKRDSLSSEEKKQMLAAIAMTQKQFPAKIVTRTTRWAFWQSTPAFRLTMAALTIVILMTMSGGTVLAAESSLPGDILYTVKVNVNERILTSMAVSAESRAQLEERLAERRLEELNTLNRMGRLTAEQKNQITTRFNVHAANSERQIAQMEAQGQIRKATALRARLNNASQKVMGIKVRLNNEEKNNKENENKNANDNTVRENNNGNQVNTSNTLRGVVEVNTTTEEADSDRAARTTTIKSETEVEGRVDVRL